MKNSQKSTPFFIKVIIPLAGIICLLMGYYIYLQKIEIEKKDTVNFIFVDKAFDEIINTLASPENCLASLGKKNAINDLGLTRLQANGSEVYALKSPIKDSNITIERYAIKSTPTELKANNAQLKIDFKNSKGMISREARLYVEVDKEDNIIFCHTLSSPSKIESKASNISLRVIHVPAEGISAKVDGVRTSIAVATCPKDFLLTGCSGSVNGCGAAGEALRKVEPQALSPNSCEVWADATAICPITAKALAICTKIIQR
jgi:hypothetical protein